MTKVVKLPETFLKSNIRDNIDRREIFIIVQTNSLHCFHIYKCATYNKSVAAGPLAAGVHKYLTNWSVKKTLVNWKKIKPESIVRGVPSVNMLHIPFEFQVSGMSWGPCLANSLFGIPDRIYEMITVRYHRLSWGCIGHYLTCFTYFGAELKL